MQKLLMCGAVLALLAASAISGAGGLTEVTRLSAAHDAILRARFDEARTTLSAACPPAPPVACRVLETDALWWEIRLDPNDRSRDARFETLAVAARSAAEAWITREPGQSEAWFYLAAALAPRVEWRVLRQQRLAAAGDARVIRNALERAIALDPGFHDAYFGIGLYHYYADVAPAALKVLRWLLLMPGGDRVKGLREMELARERGILLRGEADYQLHFVYLWYERDPDRALALLTGLDERYPSNPLFLQRIAEIERDDKRDHGAAVRSWERLLARAVDDRVAFAAMSEVRARIGIAEELIASGNHARAVDMLTPVVAAQPNAPFGAHARAQLVLARAYDGIGDRTRATRAAERALAVAPGTDPDGIRAQARALIARTDPHHDR